MKRIASAALAAVLAGSGFGAASGQQVIADPQIISGCLCQEQGVAALKSHVQQAQQRVEQDRARLDQLDRDLAQARAAVDTRNQGQVDAVKSMNLEREQLHARTFDVDIPALQAATQNYDGVASRYGARCATQSFDAVALSHIRATLACPPLPAQ